ncbi:unnamed protein product [Pocillopora meandrina]|uniref:BRICHOS domain-containing protein n=1 Tax=Pocillopora meandrina TaxID=46732 RepID=A0AAU9XL84_9CNID|nr:unnamed protein product [Pocillopora meandrina]
MIVFLISILLITLNGVQVNCITGSYSYRVSENGAAFTEEVEVDVDNQTEVLRVPQHNDVDAMEMMNDFREGLSVYRVPSARACYVSKLDSSLPEPGKMRVNMEQASMQPRLPRHVTTKKRAWRVEGFAQRSALPQKFLDFCGSFPIYTIEQTSLDFSVSSFSRGHGRFRRSGPGPTPYTFKNFATCSSQSIINMANCLNKAITEELYSGTHDNHKLECKFDRHVCYYVVDCLPNGQGVYQCNQVLHMADFLGFCCDMKCLE